MEICDLTSLNLTANILSGDDGNGPFPAQGTWSGNGVVADTEDVKAATYTAHGYDDNTITYNFVSTYGCQMESPESIQITVHSIPETLNSISKEYCLGDVSASYELRNLLEHVTGKLTWYDSGNNSLSTAPTPSTATAGTQIYYVTQTSNDCESDKATATVTVNFGNMATATQTASNWVGGEAVPEPTSGLLMLLGMAGLALRRRRA